MSATTVMNSGADAYSSIEVVYKTAHIYNGFQTTKAPFIAGGHITLHAPAGAGGEFSGVIANAIRTVSMHASGALTVDDAVLMTPSGTTTNSNMCIPYKIYGYK